MLLQTHQKIQMTLLRLLSFITYTVKKLYVGFTQFMGAIITNRQQKDFLVIAFPLRYSTIKYDV